MLVAVLAVFSFLVVLCWLLFNCLFGCVVLDIFCISGCQNSLVWLAFSRERAKERAKERDRGVFGSRAEKKKEVRYTLCIRVLRGVIPYGVMTFAARKEIDRERRQTTYHRRYGVRTLIRAVVLCALHCMAPPCTICFPLFLHV